MTDRPRAERPHMPDYGISTAADGMLGWEWVEDQLSRARNYWISSTRPDGRPHAAPVWGVWMDGALYFGSASSAQKSRNLLASPSVAVHLESGDETVILEGEVETITDADVIRRMSAIYMTKYAMPPDPSHPDSVITPNSLCFRLRPAKALAWREADFPRTATRFRLDAAG